MLPGPLWLAVSTNRLPRKTPVWPPRLPTLAKPGSGTGAVMVPVPSPESITTAEAAVARTVANPPRRAAARRAGPMETILLPVENLLEPRLVEHRDPELAC